MKKLSFLFLLLLFCQYSFSQITYINITGHNSGSGTFNLFDHYVSVNQNCYIDWEVYANGLTSGDGCGSKTQSRLVLRRMSANDPTSVIASSPIYVNGICTGKSGNNDTYFANLSSAIDLPGRYSVEVQADVLPSLGVAYDNSNTSTTWNYQCPPANYLSGSGGPTGNYYTPPASCATAGKSDPVGGSNVDMMNEVNSALKYFTVGEVGVYRAMIVVNGVFFDLVNGKFQPGNPTLPVSLNGIGPFPANGICPNIANFAPVTSSLGAEINVFKRTDCSADVTGGKTFYRIYRQGAIAPAYSSFDIGFKDDCSTGGPEGHIFPMGGSCNNINNVLDQRWQSLAGVSNILPPSFNINDTGLWNFDTYIETYAKNCAGTPFTITTQVNSTTFTVQDPNAPNSDCASLPISIYSFNATRINTSVLLQWQVAQNSSLNKFKVERSADAIHFNEIGTVNGFPDKIKYNFTDGTFSTVKSNQVYYRIKGESNTAMPWYSSILRVDKKGNAEIGILTHVAGDDATVNITNLPKGDYLISFISSDGKQVYNERFSLDQPITSSYNKQIHFISSKGIYFTVLRNINGELVSRNSFIK